MQKIDDKYLDEITEKAIQIIDRDYLMNVYSKELSINHRDIFNKAKALSNVVDEATDAGVLQYGTPIQSKPGPRVVMEFFGEIKNLIMFASNDYLNLSTDKRVHDAITTTLKNYGVGAGSSRVGTGYSYLHKKLEDQIAASFGKEAAIVFPTGYDAIASPALTLLTKDDRVIVDSSAHACIIDSSHASGAVVRYFSHNNPDRLEETLKKTDTRLKGGGILVVIEGAYSMDGDIACLDKIVPICKKYKARLLIDEAHSIGVHGSKGHGICEHFSLEKETDMIGGTFSKSLGATGGFIAADRSVVDYLNYISRKILFSAAFPPILASAVSESLKIMEEDSSLKDKLWENIRYFARGLKEVGATLLGEETASIPVLIGRDSIMFRFTRDLIKENIFTFPIVYPSVPRGKSIFRMALQTQHTKEDLDHTIDIFSKLLRKYDIIK